MRSVLPTLMLLALGQVSAVSAPITSDVPAAQSGVPWVRLSERELVGGGPRSDGLSETDNPAVPQANVFGPYDRTRNPGTDGGLAGGFENQRLLDPREAFGGNSAFDALRGFVNVAPAAKGASGRGASPRAATPPSGDPLAGIDLGPEAREWMQDAFKGIVDSVLQIDVNPRGQAAFSVLGLGQFGVAVSGDRSQIALKSGDDVLLTAQRVSPTPGGPAYPQGGGYANGAWSPGAGGSSGSAVYGESPLKKAAELVLDVASHPLSMLVYLLVAAYALLWSVLSRQPRNSAHHLKRQAASHAATAARSRTGRRRHRVRRHRHA